MILFQAGGREPFRSGLPLVMRSSTNPLEAIFVVKLLLKLIVLLLPFIVLASSLAPQPVVYSWFYMLYSFMLSSVVLRLSTPRVFLPSLSTYSHILPFSFSALVLLFLFFPLSLFRSPGFPSCLRRNRQFWETHVSDDVMGECRPSLAFLFFHRSPHG